MAKLHDSGQSTVRAERQISSTIIKEEYLEDLEEERVICIEVPVIEEVIKYVPKKEIVVVEKKVPKYEFDYVEKIVEVPSIQWVEKMVEVQVIEEVTREVHVQKVVDVPKEIIKNVPKVEVKIVEKIVEIPGEVIEVEKPYTVATEVHINQFADTEVPVVIAQSVHPHLHDVEDIIDVDVVEYEPVVMQVDVQVPKPISAQIWQGDEPHEFHRIVDVPDAQFNALLKALNPHVTDAQTDLLPFKKDVHGSVPSLAHNEPLQFVHIPPGTKIYNQDHVVLSTRETARTVDIVDYENVTHPSLLSSSSSTASTSKSERDARRKSQTKHSSPARKITTEHDITTRSVGGTSARHQSVRSHTSRKVTDTTSRKPSHISHVSRAATSQAVPSTHASRKIIQQTAKKRNACGC